MTIQVHAERCSGCRLCQQICAISHFKEINPKKSAIKIKAQFPSPGRFSPVMCDQCGECEDVCPAGAIRQESGAYVIDKDECTSCGACVEACPIGAIHIPRGEEAPVKCDLCLKCLDVCNTGALVPTALVPSLEMGSRKDDVRCTVSAERLSA